MLAFIAALLLSPSAQASDFYAGDGVACGESEGIVEKVFSGDSILVKYEFSYFEGVPRAETDVQVEKASYCVRRLGEANSTGAAELTKGDIALCGDQVGTVLAAYSENIAKIHFHASYAGGAYAPISLTYLLNVNRCERQTSGL